MMALMSFVVFVNVVNVVCNWPAIAELVTVNVAGNDFEQTQGMKWKRPAQCLRLKRSATKMSRRRKKNFEQRSETRVL